MSRDFSESELLRRSVEGRLLDVRTSIAAEIVSYDPATNRATVRPGVAYQIVDADDDPEVKKMEDLTEVPVMFPKFGDAIIYFPIGAGTAGRLEASEEDDSQFYRTNQALPVLPQILERHALGATVFRVEGSRAGVFLQGEPSNRGFIGKPGGVGISFSAEDLRLGGSDANDPLVRKSDLEALISKYNAHTHVVPAGTDLLGGIAPATTASHVGTASAILKGK